MSKGYAVFAQLPQWLMVIWFFMTTWFTKLPAYRNAKLANHWPPPQTSRQAGFKVKNETGEAPKGGPSEPQFPLIMFSHGMGGSRTAYSSVCGEFGARTFINHPWEGKGSRKEMEENGNVDHRDEEVK